MDVVDGAMYFKYRSCSSRTWDLLQKHEIYFSLPGDLNDPLDVSIDVKSEYERAKKHVYETDTHPEGRKSFLITMLDSIKKGVTEEGEDISLSQALYLFMQSRGVLSLSKSAHDALLWSHYADGHRGLCLGFNTEILQVDGMTSAGDVQYLPNPPYMEKFLALTEEFGEFCRPWDKVHFSDEQGKNFYNKQVDAMLQIGLFTKSEDWKYEKEFRIISNPGNHSFSPSALQEVIIGAKTSKVNEERINDLLSAREYSHVRLKKAFNVPGTFTFGSLPLK
ncbi:DUF2971 domain-containing protein [Pseudomonas syringae]|uniref:DUF2971 domain-containing protein n=1 Tax=Pseudomonas syringae TaxID=317 RepID=UPI000465ED97|nr:DUF2971 domain-containing protein [Pseudomonas syringae]QGG73891.1 DUF2971 domain-containing protein [Pseudomonas syringae USA011]